jgi:hypothetical protein
MIAAESDAHEGAPREVALTRVPRARYVGAMRAEGPGGRRRPERAESEAPGGAGALRRASLAAVAVAALFAASLETRIASAGDGAAAEVPAASEPPAGGVSGDVAPGATGAEAGPGATGAEAGAGAEAAKASIAPGSLAGAEGAPSGGSITPGDGALLEPEPLDRALRGLFVEPLRFRYERRDDHDLREDLRDRDTRTLGKIGFGIDARPLEPLRARVALRATRTWDRNLVNRAARIDLFGQDHLDVFEAFGEVGPLEGLPLSARVGRQTLAFGEERLLGPLEFVQNARSWDMARLRFESDDLTADAFWGRLVLFEGYDDRNLNRPVETTDLLGVYASLRLLEGALTVEPFYIAKFDDNRPILGERGSSGHHLLLHSPGVRAVWKPLPFILWADAVLQLGRRGRDDILAYGLVGKAAWRAPEWLRPLFEIETELVYGSGDRDPADGRVETFDNLYPTNHKFYGELDLASWQNIQDWRLTARFELYRARLHAPPPERPEDAPPRYVWQRAEEALAPHEMPFNLEVGWHFLWLATPRDAWYNAALRPIRADPSGRAPRDLGGELDIVFRVGGLSIGVAQLFTGGFVRRTTPPGGDRGDPQLFYVEYNVTF